MKKISIIISYLFFSLLSNCAGDYTCGSVPGSKCKNVDQVYESTNTGVKDYRTSLYKGETGNNYKEKIETLEISTYPVTLKQVTSGDPILTNPDVLRVLITSWEDADKDLHAGGYIYMRLKDSEWRL